MPSNGGVKETITSITHRGPRPVYCPRCLSTEMHQTATFGILPAKYRCSNCGYEGTLVLELDDDPRSGGPDDRREVA